VEAVLPSHAARGRSEESKGFARAKPATEAAKAREDSIVKMRDGEKSE
jgi:hypothetical protein